MKILSTPVFEVVVSLTSEEIKGILKIIGPTSHSQRKEQFGMTEEQSLAMEELYGEFISLLGKTGA